MALPYHLLKVCGSTVFAAQGSDIHSFSSALEYISTWKYPVHIADEANVPSTEAQDSPAPEGPPAKRRKMDGGKESASNGQPKSKKAAQYIVPANERPFVQGLYATTDGCHLVAITGSDKTIWVFEHDGRGNLKLLSQRAMPKRPCSLTLTPDNHTILSADKFGDVYALPLLQSTTTTTPPTSDPIVVAPLPKSRSATPSTPAAPSTPTPLLLKPQGNELTVHTKRNLKALENQKISMDRNSKAQQDQLNGAAHDVVVFEHTLLLGHVSMLTAICIGTTSGSREYIITADRDEHIRVSRGMPQAHVIEGFCLGHEDFVSRLCVAPGGKARILISGGGDDDLFVWDWARGQLLGKAGVLEHVRRAVVAVEGEASTTKVAVSRVFGCRWEGATGVFVVVERVPALFRYELLEDNTLCHRETIPLPGNVLDVEMIEASGVAPPRLLVAVDPGASAEGLSSSSSLILLDKEEAGWRQSNVENLPAGADVNISTKELQKILYSTETLRKSSDFD
ncbi:hypothetical protein C8A00DRAFT_44929 [Chaetomidium leptoderma]|uniref:Transfer RNA methyltransferase 82 n=1 Tax=Chaetomidium leptoderma TaxID=669021 RepID=A0AAN6VI31_9PEZI|nr:hypothetical protein C8A00DRAFT_44929 [Chaetomidium leptoderma]